MDYQPRTTQREPIKVYSEKEALSSGNTWEYLKFEQLRAIRFIQQSLFCEPSFVRGNILTMICQINHLETLLFQKIMRNKESQKYRDYLKNKPTIFADLTDETGIQKIMDLLDTEAEQMLIVAMLEKWQRALEPYCEDMKPLERATIDIISPDKSLEMAVP